MYKRIIPKIPQTVGMGPSFAKTGDKNKIFWMENCTQEKRRDDQTGCLT
jgi:hypothetical protein